ncbi:bucentaur or craniofacial development-domain-containing protein [Microdochium trichocladiopsis]|uniref:SWR1-complex protein 5 n=1 Tax=Microdochium trichocladiopsis TaxID=1682393 RepID=A0A9P8YGD6_9PEZI|nr:bucentaur or craniofacial development-domain-containing protein [Microdochium trichocladiopsis]KAH7041222.1 bucentaur or craniofacial development-domain-containing protein [Microdochium trichocladiopsis]
MAGDSMLLDDDEDYASDQDSDFAPDDGDDAAHGGGADQDGGSSDDDDDSDDSNDGDGNGTGSDSKPALGSLQDTAATAAAAAAAATTSSSAGAAAAKGRKREHGQDNDDGFENSGDEAIIQKGQKKLSRNKKKKNKTQRGGDQGDEDDEDEDEGGVEGGLIKTRSMRAAEKAERRDRGVVPSGPVTINVDDLWAQMSAGSVLPGKESGHDRVSGAVAADSSSSAAGADKENQEPGTGSADGDVDMTTGDKTKSKMQTSAGGGSDALAMIKIKRTYNFAGKVHTEEKLVARDSAEAKLYIASLDPKSAEYIALTTSTSASDGDNGAAANADEEASLRRPRKAFRSIFEPVIADPSSLQRSDLNLGLSATLQLREAAFRQGKAKKLNVVEKSRMDWAGFVDKEGIKDELELAGRSKESYAHRQDFLSRVEANREDEARRARLAGRG